MKNTEKKTYIEIVKMKTLDELYELVERYKYLQSQIENQKYEVENLKEAIKKDLDLINNEIFNKITS